MVLSATLDTLHLPLNVCCIDDRARLLNPPRIATLKCPCPQRLCSQPGNTMRKKHRFAAFHTPGVRNRLEDYRVGSRGLGVSSSRIGCPSPLQRNRTAPGLRIRRIAKVEAHELLHQPSDVCLSIRRPRIPRDMGGRYSSLQRSLQACQTA
ncbi:hypothetical protein N657DRAFT_230589 [Parathielavia appendiculata]|uniref:Uncharacterized protein n=1 Tax=Parathielavia appendiculata TaxID=2587402 RepID=A0AAN6U7I1_9PEZI|nr:hypothetical protein N657DRAFT_230589 [Parathielavia appendiculata]